MKRETNFLLRVVQKNLNRRALITYKLGKGLESIEAVVLGYTDSLICLRIKHPQPFINNSLMIIEENPVTKKKERLPKLVQEMLIPISNITEFILI
jgi:hypothetical protein